MELLAGVSQVKCTGSEASLADCPLTDIDGSECEHQAGVLCRGDVYAIKI